MLIEFKKNNSLPLKQQLFDAIKDAILSGRLGPGQRLPSTRELAAELLIARNTVANAYDELVASGLVESVQGSGMYVATHVPKAPGLNNTGPGPSTEESGGKLSNYANAISQHEQAGNSLISYRLPRRQDLPTKKWHQLVLKHSKIDQQTGPAWNSDVLGYLPLRQALAKHLQMSRALKCNAEHVVLFSSRREALDFWCKVLVEPGELVIMEKPHHPLVEHLFRANGARIEQVSTDDLGMVVGELKERTDVRAVYLTPSHQVVTGAVLPKERRIELISWAQSVGACIIEDDFDCEFVPQDLLAQSIQGLDSHGNTVYVGCVANSLSPLTEQAYSVIANRLLETTRKAREIFAGCAARSEEKVLSDFIEGMGFTQHIRALKAGYGKRRELLCRELEAEAGRFNLDSYYSGTCLLVKVVANLTAEQVELCGSKAGLPLVNAQRFAGCTLPADRFLLSYCRVPEDDVATAVKIFLVYLDECERDSAKHFRSVTGRMSMG